MNLIIRKIALLNFKGIRNLKIDFYDKETFIYGDNGTGKSTVFDAFTWVLFGKDSLDRKEFNIKTLDENNEAIAKIPHEVSVELCRDGEIITLRKCYSEKWVAVRGNAEKEFRGHTVDCFYNEVPCSVTEYNKKIADLCNEQIFKLITNPLYFTSQKKEVQRNMLFQLAGEITTNDILQEHAEFRDLVNALTGKTLEEYKREIAAKKKTIKDGIESIPARIDECKRDMPEAQNWNLLETSINSHKAVIDEIDEQIADRSKTFEEATKAKQELVKKLSDIKTKISQREYELDFKLRQGYVEAKRNQKEAADEINRLQGDRRHKAMALPRLQQELDQLNEKRNRLIAEWKSIKAETITFNEDQFVCPTCHRPLEADDIEQRKSNLTAVFYGDKAARLERNKKLGLENKAAIEAKNEEISMLKDQLFGIDEQLGNLTNSAAYMQKLVEPDTTAAIATDEQIVELKYQATQLQKTIDAEITAPDVADLRAQRSEEEQKLKEDELWLRDRDYIEQKNNRIAELENELKKSGEQLAEYEGIEDMIFRFTKAKIDMVESRINGMFSIVKFKMFEQQINGGEAETCEAMVNGVPFSDLNNAMKINAGLDIINAISRANNISAPIFIDNRESVVDITSVHAQVVNLVVEKGCKTLRVASLME